MAILTVYTKLLERSLEGARIIDMGTTKSCECYVLPRDKVAEVAKKYPRIQQYGLYILLGHNKQMKPMAYVGKTNDFTTRVNDHKYKKDFWDTALLFVSKLGEIYESEALYLEYLGWKYAKEANNYVIENAKDIYEPALSEDKKNEMESFFEDILFLTRFYGCKVFDEPEKPVVPESCFVFKMSKPQLGISATLNFYRQSHRYIIKSGSMIAIESKSCSKSITEFREQVMANKKLSERKGELYTLLQDIDIPELSCSPSGAASFCTGTSMQGTEAWADKNGNKYPSEWWKDPSVIM